MGSGTLTLSGQNTHTGLTNVQAGTLAFTNANAMTLGRSPWARAPNDHGLRPDAEQRRYADL
ncbi:MAG: autotransporter-associated beta strand repeat-containing protein [Akkermansia sp.]